MIRINLLPPEITRRRKDEERWRWVVIGAIVSVVVVIGAFGILQVQVSLKQEEVASYKQQAEGLRVQSNRFKVFAEKQADLASRQAIATQALSGRIDWSRLYGEIALVLPGDIFLTAMKGTQPNVGKDSAPTPGSLTLDGKALDFPNDVPDQGYKSLAKMLVRLAELTQIDDVWMSESTKPAASAADRYDLNAYILFGVSAKIPGDPGSAAAGGPPPVASTSP